MVVFGQKIFSFVMRFVFGQSSPKNESDNDALHKINSKYRVLVSREENLKKEIEDCEVFKGL